MFCVKAYVCTGEQRAPTLVGYESILNMSQKVEGVPVGIGALPFRRNLSSAYVAAAAAYYGAGATVGCWVAVVERRNKVRTEQ